MTHEIKYNCVIYNRSLYFIWAYLLLVVYFQCQFLTFLELRGIFSLKAVSVLNWKNSKIMFLNRQFLSVFLELRLCFDLKYVLVLKIGQTWIKLTTGWSTVFRLRFFEFLVASNHTKVRWKYISKILPISFF